MPQVGGPEHKRAAGANGDKTTVFISYSRRDRDFVDRLVEALNAHRHIDIFRDTDDILPTEEWKERLESLIGAADTIVFCLSPDSAVSEVCQWEADLAERLNKRIAPIVVRDVDGDIPPVLARLNHIFFTREDDFRRSLGYLVTALDADISWIRENTRLGELARRWERSGKPRDQLLHGSDVGAAEAWLRGKPRNAPPPTDLTQRYIAESRFERTALVRRARRGRVLVLAMLVGIIAGLVGWIYQAVLQEQYKWFFVTRPYMNMHVRPYVLSERADRELKPGAQFKDCPGCPDMVVIPPGRFVMGSPPDEPGRGEEEGPQCDVRIDYALAVSRLEITVEQWDRCIAYGDCAPRSPESGESGPRAPVVEVTWFDAKRYVAWLSRLTGKHYRLLSESEWEYAARAGAQTPYPWGDAIGVGNAVCETCGTSWDQKNPAPAGSLPPNAFGLHDMHGNVWEWTEDCYYDDYRGAPADGSPRLNDTCRRRSVRGGSFDYSPKGPRSAARYRYVAGNVVDDLGLRVAREIGTDNSRDRAVTRICGAIVP